MSGYQWQKDISGCGLAGFINRKGERVGGEMITKAIVCQDERGNGLGAGFAAYGIYPEFRDLYALHVMYDSRQAQVECENYFKDTIHVVHAEEIPTRPTKGMERHPILRRYFGRSPKEVSAECVGAFDEDDYIVRLVMDVNRRISGAFIFSSGKNMGAFKGVGYASQVAEFFRIDEYEGHIWTAHTRFPTNTPGWWGGAHPFTLLDWSIVHNGEISSYGINKRYLEMFGYHCTLFTDTEVVAYLLDLLIRKHGLSKRMACHVLAPPFWTDIDRMNEEDQRSFTALRSVYGSGVLNGPFAILFAYNGGIVGLNDRIKLRPLVVATKDDWTFMASEECAIRAVCPDPTRVWAPRAGEPVIAELEIEDTAGKESKDDYRSSGKRRNLLGSGR
ncbi:MAG: glutamine amidotransferase family protein [Pseudomonadota bacterium]